MPSITPHLWYDKQAVEAAEFYTSLFPDSQIDSSTVLRDTPSGDAEMVAFTIWGMPFAAISAGPLFKFNPSVSFMVNFDPAQDADAATRIDAVWEKLIDGGGALMELGEYPFSKRYGWLADKYGLTWQLILTNPDGEERPPIVPSLMFTGDVYGKAEEATDFYISVFDNAKRGGLFRYGKDAAPDKEGAVMFTDFMLEGQWFAAMESAYEHGFTFNEAISFIVNCDNQRQIDYFWDKLSAVPEAEQCGWLKDEYGLSWQIVPTAMGELMGSGDAEAMARVTQAFLPMKKLDIAALERAARGE